MLIFMLIFQGYETWGAENLELSFKVHFSENPHKLLNKFISNRCGVVEVNFIKFLVVMPLICSGKKAHTL